MGCFKTVSSCSYIVNIRELASGDLSDILSIEWQSSQFPWSEGLIKSSLNSDSGFGLFDDSSLIGFTFFSQVLDELSLLNIAIAPEYRRQGLAYDFLAACLSSELVINIGCCFLEVRESNLPAISLYKKLGFDQVGLRKNYYPINGGRETAVIMKLIFPNGLNR